MLTDKQLTQTALTSVLDYLDDRLKPDFDAADYLDRLVCEQHCPGPDCDRTDADWPREEAVMNAEVRDAVEFLRVSLAQYAADRGITLPTNH